MSPSIMRPRVSLARGPAPTRMAVLTPPVWSDDLKGLHIPPIIRCTVMSPIAITTNDTPDSVLTTAAGKGAGPVIPEIPPWVAPPVTKHDCKPDLAIPLTGSGLGRPRADQH